MEQLVLRICRIIHTSATVCMALLTDIVKLVGSSVMFFLTLEYEMYEHRTFLCALTKRCMALHFKLAVLVYKALHSQLPQYLAEDYQILTDIGRRSLRSADVLTCATIRTRTRLGDGSFSVAGLCLWNSLPVALCDRDISFVQFKRLLKTLWFV